MPREDGTGPMGMGPMTGWGAGYCAGFAVPGFMNPMPGRSWGLGRGWGRGFGRGMAWRRAWGYPLGAYPAAVPYGAAAAPQDEVEILKNQAKYFAEALEGINKRIAELEAEKK